MEKPNQIKFYIGISHTKFKIRLANHKSTFNNEKYRFSTSLSKYYWELKDKNLTPNVKWEILRQTQTCRNLDAPCHLCLEERIAINYFEDKHNLLNNKYETTIICKHKSKFLLCNLKFTL